MQQPPGALPVVAVVPPDLRRCLLRRWCSRRRRPRPPARSPHASLKARSGRSRSPPWPCRRPPAPRPGPAGPAAASNRACVRVLALPPPTGAAATPYCLAVHAAASGRGIPGTVVHFSNFACNSPCAHCMFVSVHAAESLLFGNCMRLWGGRGVSGCLGRRGRIGAVAGGVGASRAKVPCVRRWEEVWVEMGDRAKGFP